MNKLKRSLLTLLLSAAALALVSCGSTDTDETVINTVEANHITVNVTKSNVKITLSKSEGEEIDTIDVVDEKNGTLTSVAMTEPQITFVWPFAEAGKEYTLTAKINAKNNYQEETVTFKVENEMSALIEYSDEYETSVISLIAKSNQRFLKLDTAYSTISSAFDKAKIENAKLIISLYSGKHYKAAASDSILAGQMIKDFSNKAVLDPFKNGFDVISNASELGLTPAELNQKLSSKLTYFAVAQVQFSLPDTPAGIIFTAKGIYSNDTIYTPIAEQDLPQVSTLSAGDAK